MLGAFSAFKPQIQIFIRSLETKPVAQDHCKALVLGNMVLKCRTNGFQEKQRKHSCKKNWKIIH